MFDCGGAGDFIVLIRNNPRGESLFGSLLCFGGLWSLVLRVSLPLSFST